MRIYLYIRNIVLLLSIIASVSCCSEFTELDIISTDVASGAEEEEYREKENGNGNEKEQITYVNGIGHYLGFTSQGLAIHDNYAFITYDTGLFQVLDMDSMTIISSFPMPAGANHKNNHAGIAVFGKYYYDEGDEFPLLYVSSYLEHKCYVLRVTTSTASLIQELTMADSWHFFVDDNEMIVRLCDNTYHIFPLPDPKRGNMVLNKSDANSHFFFDIPNMLYAGAYCDSGRMYILCYYATTPSGIFGKYDRLIEYDFRNDCIINEKIFVDYHIRETEFEGLSKSPKGGFIISFIADQLAIVDF